MSAPIAAPAPGRWRRRLRRLGLTLLLGVVALGLGLSWRARAAFPVHAGRVELPAAAGLSAPVEVIRDAHGVPHLYAQTDEDLLFAQGFVHAQDRLWAMDFDRRLATGRLSEILGGQTLRLDRYLRTLGLPRLAAQDWQLLSPATQRLVEAYCAGINAYLVSPARRLPIEYTLTWSEPAPFTPTDVLARSKLMSWLLSQNQQFETSRARMIAALGAARVQELLPPYADGAPVIVPPGANGYGFLRQAELEDELQRFWAGSTYGWGSNQWSLAGERTASGKPMLANDTHLLLSMPSIWYHVGLHSPGFDVVGASMPGIPLVLVGTNGKIAWGITDMLPDVQDYFILRVDDRANPRRYEYQGGWRDLELDRQTIRVRGRGEVELTVYRSHLGPIANEIVGRLKDYPETLAIRWSEQDPARSLEALVGLNRATDWASFRAALADWAGPHLNFGYADAAGNIGYQAAGHVPIRKSGHQGLLPMPGWTGEHEWQGFIPAAELPFELNPSDGLVLTANQKVAADEYPYHLAYEWSDPYRAIHLRRKLLELERATAADSARLQGDSYSLHAAALRPVLLAVEPRSEVERAALEQVRAWNGELTVDSAAAAIHQVWYRHLLRATLYDELGEVFGPEYLVYEWIHGPMFEALVRSPGSSWFDDVRTAAVREQLPAIAQRAFEQAVAWLVAEQGGDPSRWSWGALHPAAFIHRGLGPLPLVGALFNGPRLPVPGDRYTANAAWFQNDHPDSYASEGGPGQRFFVDLADPDSARFSQSTGQTEQLGHHHRDDLIDPWRQSQLLPLPFTRPAVEAAGRERLVLAPPP